MPIETDGWNSFSYLAAALEANGCKSYTDCDLNAAMQVISEIRPALLCVEIVMPRETGITFHLRLRQKEELDNILVFEVSKDKILEESDSNFYDRWKSASIPGSEVDEHNGFVGYVRRMEVVWRSGMWNLRLREYGMKPYNRIDGVYHEEGARPS